MAIIGRNSSRNIGEYFILSIIQQFIESVENTQNNWLGARMIRVWWHLKTRRKISKQVKNLLDIFFSDLDKNKISNKQFSEKMNEQYVEDYFSGIAFFCATVTASSSGSITLWYTIQSEYKATMEFLAEHYWRDKSHFKERLNNIHKKYVYAELNDVEKCGTTELKNIWGYTPEITDLHIEQFPKLKEYLLDSN